MDNYHKEEIGKRLKQCRKEKHLTQEQLSEMLGISQKHYSEAERGLTGLSVKQLIKISNILSISLDYLLKGSAPSDPLTASYHEFYEISRLYAISSEFTRKNMLQLVQIAYNMETFYHPTGQTTDPPAAPGPKNRRHKTDTTDGS